MDLALLAYRNPTLSSGATPAQLLYGRSLRDRIPPIKKLIPKIPGHNKIKEEMLKEKKKQKAGYDIRYKIRGKKDSRAGDEVWIVNNQREGMIEQ
ncbi:hypothetical protein JTB14_018076 [Gonioctena quinquepunctata]|nr:hypothetical protein JTB14_018076 [Gonioctena quinquepunctata]